MIARLRLAGSGIERIHPDFFGMLNHFQTAQSPPGAYDDTCPVDKLALKFLYFTSTSRFITVLSR